MRQVDRIEVTMGLFGLMRLGVSVGWALSIPLLMLAIPMLALLDLFPGRPWQAVMPLYILIWAILSGYTALVMRSVLPQQTEYTPWVRRVERWFLMTLIYIAIAAADTYGSSMLRAKAGFAGLELFALVAFAGMIVQFLLKLAPAISAIKGATPIAAVKESIQTLVRDWRRPVALIVLDGLGIIPIIFVHFVLLSHQLPPPQIPWKGAIALLSALMSAIFFLPVLGLTGYLALNCPDLSWRGSLRVDELPYVIRLGAAFVSPAVLAAAANLLLEAVTPFSLTVAGSPRGDIAFLMGFFLPLSSVEFLILLLPGILAGWLAERTSQLRWPGAVAGGLYGLLIIHIQLGVKPFQMTWLLHFYVLGILLYALSGLAGSALSRRIHRDHGG